MYDLAFDIEAERAAAEIWMRSTFSIPEAIDLSGPGLLLNDLRFIRGTELWHLGLYENARAEFESLRADISISPMDNFRLANYLYGIGLYRSAIFAARQVLNLAGMDDAGTLSAPIYFNRLRFGPYYRELVLPAADAYDFHPLFLITVLRQESLFEGFVRSDAGARGLMQIMPGTAEDIVANLGWPPGYRAEDLYRPTISVILGADYLDAQRNYFDGDLYGALAAYNAGPGNAKIWRDLAGGDEDLFLEIIRFEETRNYIKGIYEVFSIYRRLYDRSP
jgi:soluble lytic murein transglycosylase